MRASAAYLARLILCWLFCWWSVVRHSGILSGVDCSCQATGADFRVERLAFCCRQHRWCGLNRAETAPVTPLVFLRGSNPAGSHLGPGLLSCCRHLFVVVWQVRLRNTRLAGSLGRWADLKGCRVYVCKRVDALGTVYQKLCPGECISSCALPVLVLLAPSFLGAWRVPKHRCLPAASHQHPTASCGVSSGMLQHHTPTHISFYALVVNTPHACSYALQRLWQAHACLAVGALVIVLYYYALCRTKLCPVGFIMGGVTAIYMMRVEHVCWVGWALTWDILCNPCPRNCPLSMHVHAAPVFCRSGSHTSHPGMQGSCLHAPGSSFACKPGCRMGNM